MSFKVKTSLYFFWNKIIIYISWPFILKAVDLTVESGFYKVCRLLKTCWVDHSESDHEAIILNVSPAGVMVISKDDTLIKTMQFAS